MAASQLDLDAIQLFDTGRFYVLEWLDPEEDDGRKECAVMVIMKRAGGLLLAIPDGFLPEETLVDGTEDERAMVGHSKVMTVAGVLLEEGVTTPIGSNICFGGRYGHGRLGQASRDGGRGGHSSKLLRGGRVACTDLGLVRGARGWRSQERAPVVHTRADRGQCRGVNKELERELKSKGKASSSRWGYAFRRSKREGKETYHRLPFGSTSRGNDSSSNFDKPASACDSEAAELGGEDGIPREHFRNAVSAFRRTSPSSFDRSFGKRDPKAPKGETNFDPSSPAPSKLTNRVEGDGGDQRRGPRRGRCGQSNVGSERSSHQPGGPPHSRSPGPNAGIARRSDFRHERSFGSGPATDGACKPERSFLSCSPDADGEENGPHEPFRAALWNSDVERHQRCEVPREVWGLWQTEGAWGGDVPGHGGIRLHDGGELRSSKGQHSTAGSHAGAGKLGSGPLRLGTAAHASGGCSGLNLHSSAGFLSQPLQSLRTERTRSG